MFFFRFALNYSRRFFVRNKAKIRILSVTIQTTLLGHYEWLGKYFAVFVGPFFLSLSFPFVFIKLLPLSPHVYDYVKILI